MHCTSRYTLSDSESLCNSWVGFVNIEVNIRLTGKQLIGRRRALVICLLSSLFRRQSRKLPSKEIKHVSPPLPPPTHNPFAAISTSFIPELSPSRDHLISRVRRGRGWCVIGSGYHFAHFRDLQWNSQYITKVTLSCNMRVYNHQL